MVRSEIHILQLTKSKKKNSAFSDIVGNCVDVLLEYMPAEYRRLDQQQYTAVRATLREILELSRQNLVSG